MSFNEHTKAALSAEIWSGVPGLVLECVSNL